MKIEIPLGSLKAFAPSALETGQIVTIPDAGEGTRIFVVAAGGREVDERFLVELAGSGAFRAHALSQIVERPIVLGAGATLRVAFDTTSTRMTTELNRGVLCIGERTPSVGVEWTWAGSPNFALLDLETWTFHDGVRDRFRYCFLEWELLLPLGGEQPQRVGISPAAD